jgi:hypothetical protein
MDSMVSGAYDLIGGSLLPLTIRPSGVRRKQTMFRRNLRHKPQPSEKTVGASSAEGSYRADASRARTRTSTVIMDGAGRVFGSELVSKLVRSLA